MNEYILIAKGTLVFQQSSTNYYWATQEPRLEFPFLKPHGETLPSNQRRTVSGFDRPYPRTVIAAHARPARPGLFWHWISVQRQCIFAWNINATLSPEATNILMLHGMYGGKRLTLQIPHLLLSECRRCLSNQSFFKCGNKMKNFVFKSISSIIPACKYKPAYNANRKPIILILLSSSTENRQQQQQQHHPVMWCKSG